MDGAVDNLPTLPDAAVWELLQRMELKTFLRSRQVCEHASNKMPLFAATALSRHVPLRFARRGMPLVSGFPS